METTNPQIGELLREAVERKPNAIALQFNGREYPWSFVSGIVTALQEQLNTLGIESSERVGFITHTRPTHVATLWGLLIANRCPSMIYGFQSPQKLAQDIQSLRYPLIVADQQDWTDSLVQAAKDAGSAGIALSDDGIQVVTGLQRVGDKANRETVRGAAVETLSSGTTGKPKRILLSKQNLLSSALAAAQSIKQMSASTAEITPLIVMFPLANISGVYSTVPACLSGHPIALMEKFTVNGWLQLIRRYRPVTADVPPTALSMLVDAGVHKQDLASLRVIRSGAAPLDLQVQKKFYENFGIPINLSYGASEFCGVITTWTMQELESFGETKLGSCGRALPGVQLRVTNPDTGAILSTNEIGLLEALVERVGPNWIRTSDLVRIDEDGFMWFEGREDTTIIRGGFKVSPEAVADVLRQHPQVREAAVIGEADKRLGEVPVAFIEASNTAKPPIPAILEAYARNHLSAYQIPVRFVMVETLPRTPSMKLDLRKLKKML